MNDENGAIDAEAFEPDIQSGVEYSKPKNLNAAGSDHPLYQRVRQYGLDEAEGVDTEDGDTIPVNVPPTILKHVSDSLYQSDEATIREFLANGETACLRVESGEGQVVPENYSPTIEVTWRRDKNKLVIQDNGIGISSPTAIKVLRRIGVTTIRDSGNYSGQFGMGFFSFLKLIGPMNSMIMQTRSRQTDENYAAYVNLSGFDPIQGGMPEGEYGTKFIMFPSDPDIEIQDYVEKYSEWLRVPVHYEEIDENGQLVFDEDWGGKTFVDTYGEGVTETTVEEPGFFKAVMSPDATGKTLLLSMEIDRNDGDRTVNTHEAPYKFDTRLMDESGAVVNCDCDGKDHKGLSPVPDAEYKMMEPERQEHYIPESEITDNDLCLPEPTSSRDSLQQNEDFWIWVSRRLADKFERECKEIFEEYDDFGDIINLKGRGLDQVVRTVEEQLRWGRSRSLQQAIEQEFGVTLDSDACDVLKVMNKECGLAPRGETGISNKDSREVTKVYKVLNEAYPEGDVFMGVTLNQRKAEVVWDMHEKNQVVHVESSDKYKQYDRLFDWRKLKEINLDNLDQYDISDDLYEEISGEKKKIDKAKNIDRNEPTPPDEEMLNVSMSQSYRRQEKIQSDAVHAAFKDGEPLDVSGYEVDTLILFPSKSDNKISDCYWMGGEDSERVTALSNCNIGTYHYLKDLPQVHHADEYFEESFTHSFESSKGSVTIAEEAENLVIHVVEPENKTKFLNVASEMEEVVDYIHKEQYIEDSTGDSSSLPYNFPDRDDIAYAPLTEADMWNIRPAVRDEEVIVIRSEASAYGLHLSFTFRTDLHMYAMARLNDWDWEAEEFWPFKKLGSSRGATLEDVYPMIETLGAYHDQGEEPHSEKAWV